MASWCLMMSCDVLWCLMFVRFQSFGAPGVVLEAKAEGHTRVPPGYGRTHGMHAQRDNKKTKVFHQQGLAGTKSERLWNNEDWECVLCQGSFFGQHFLCHAGIWGTITYCGGGLRFKTVSNSGRECHRNWNASEGFILSSVKMQLRFSCYHPWKNDLDMKRQGTEYTSESVMTWNDRVFVLVSLCCLRLVMLEPRRCSISVHFGWNRLLKEYKQTWEAPL